METCAEELVEGEPIPDIAKFVTDMCGFILRQALEGNIDNNRLNNRRISPITLTNMVAGVAIRVIQETLTQPIDEQFDSGHRSSRS